MVSQRAEEEPKRNNAQAGQAETGGVRNAKSPPMSTCGEAPTETRP